MAAPLDKIDQELRKKIAFRIKELREKTGKKQKQFADDYDTDKQTWNRYEKGRGASIYTVNKFCKAIGISLSDFFDSPLFKDSKK